MRMKLAIPAGCPGKSNCENVEPAMRATGKGHRSCWIHNSLVRPPDPVLRTQLPDQQFVRMWNQARDQGGPVGCRDWVLSPVQAKGEAGDGGVAP